MISGLLLTPKLTVNTINTVDYTLKPYDTAEGPTRAMQKFVVILLTTQGTDALHPWLGTNLKSVTKMNINAGNEVILFVKDQINKAVSQFFRLQANEGQQNNQTVYDIITDIELMDIGISKNNRIVVTLKFTPAARESIFYSLEF